MKLINTTKNISIVENLNKAEQIFARMKGLLGRKSLPDDEALWITACTSIHTFFMNFAIDVVFVDTQLKVKACYENVKPWRMVGPVWSANSVIEFAPGSIARCKIEIGDQLNVAH